MNVECRPFRQRHAMTTSSGKHHAAYQFILTSFIGTKFSKRKKKQTSKLQVTYLEMSEAPGNHKVANLIFKLSLIREGFHETSWFEREFLRQI